jgi:hypothetical protein
MTSPSWYCASATKASLRHLLRGAERFRTLILGIALQAPSAVDSLFIGTSLELSFELLDLLCLVLLR